MNDDNRPARFICNFKAVYDAFGNLKLGCLLLRLSAWVMLALQFSGSSCLADHISPQTPIMEVAGVERKSLQGYLEVFRAHSDLSVQFLIEKNSTEFKKIPGTLSEGFTSDAVWVSFTLQNKTLSEPQELWIEMEQPLFRNIQFYAWGEGGPEAMSARPPHRLREHAFDYRKASFRVVLHDRSPHRFLARIQTPTSVSADVLVWDPRAFVRAHANERFAWGILFGGYLLVIAFYTVFSLVTRESIHGVYALYVSLTFLSTFFTGAWPIQIFSWMTDDVFNKLLALWIFLSLPVATIFSFEYLGVSLVWPRFAARLTFGTSALAFIALALTLFGHQHRVMPIFQSLALVMMGCFAVLSILLASRGLKHGKFFLLAFLPFYIGIGWRFLKNIGFLDHSFMSENSYHIGAFVHIMLMSFGLFVTYSNIRKEKDLIEAKLEAESALRKEHADFMAMISHEFRTPLSIIGAASDNLLHASHLSDKDAMRVQKIMDANLRLHELMQNTLSSERLLFDAVTMPIEKCDLVSCVLRAKADVEPIAGGFLHVLPTDATWVMGNPELIRVAIANLLSNAKRYSPVESEIRVWIDCDERWVSVRVQDAGNGIAQEEIHRVFDKYYRGGHAAGKPGAGLGLYLVRLIMSRHNGRAEVVNNPQGGSTFSLYFPRLLDISANR
jgi:signal transduction histidine kinase